MDHTTSSSTTAAGVIKRVTRSAHDAVDSVTAKVSCVADGLQGGVDKAADALVIGAALPSLRSSRDD
jgi:hypothetical protein